MPAEAVTWQSIHAEVLRRIRDRTWPPGQVLPHDDKLAAEFGCARGTVSRALRELADVGILDRRRKAGTRVAVSPVRKATLEIPVIRKEIEARGGRYGHMLITREILPPPLHVRSALDLPDDTPLLHLMALHLSDDAPWCLEDRWIDLRTVPALADVDLRRISANQWLVENVAYTAGTLALSATAADAEAAEALRCPEGAALFVIERATFLNDRPITFVRQKHPPAFRMTTSV